MPIGYNGLVSWTRRRVLQALGASALTPALPSVLTPWLTSCGSAKTGSPVIAMPVRASSEIRSQLREAVESLARELGPVAALAVIQRRGGAMADGTERRASQTMSMSLRIAVLGQGTTIEQVSDNLGRDGVARVVEAVRTRALAARRSAPPDPAPAFQALGPPRDQVSQLVIDPRSALPGTWNAEALRLYDRASSVGGSRIVYRSAYLAFDDSETLFLGDGLDRFQRIVRVRTGVVFVAQNAVVQSVGRSGARSGDPSASGRVSGPARRVTGDDTAVVPALEVCENHGTAGLEAMALSAEALDGAAARALSIISPLLPQGGDTDVVLEPSVAALIVRQCLAPALDGQQWVSGACRAAGLRGQPLAPAEVSLLDDPTLSGGFGSYFFDHEGADARPTPLIEGGALRGPLLDRRSARALGLPATGSARQQTMGGAISPLPSNLILSPGQAQLEELIATIDSGLLIEGGSSARTDVRTWRFVVRASRAREIIKGKLSGVLFGAVDLHGTIPDLLAAIRGLSATRERQAFDLGAASSVTSPYILTRTRVIPVPRV